jgi:hypothetical protein
MKARYSVGIIEWVLILAGGLVFVVVAGVMIRSLGPPRERSDSSND